MKGGFRMSKKFVLALIIFILTPCFAFAQKEVKRDVILELEGRYWFTDLQGKIKVTDSNDVGTDIDLKTDLGINDENIPEIRLFWYPGRKTKIWAAYGRVGYEGDENIQKTIEFGDSTYTVGTRVETDLDINYFNLSWAWQFIYIDNGFLKLGTLLEAKVFWVKGSLEAPDLTTPVKESDSFVFGLPTLGFAFDLNPHRMLNIYAQGSGMYAGNYGYMYDAEIGVKLIPIKILSIMGGYRMMQFRAEHDENYARAKLHGPFVGVTVRF
jgi:hypothetical protein